MDYLDLEENLYRLEIIKANKKGEKSSLNGFSLYRNGNCVEFLCKKGSVLVKWMDSLSKFCVMTNLNDKYRIQNILGTGGYGKVSFLAKSIKMNVCLGLFIRRDIRQEQMGRKVHQD